MLRPPAPDVDILENRIVAVRNCRDAEGRHLAHTTIAAGKLAERPFQQALALYQLGFDYDLAVRQDIHPVARLGQADGRTHHFGGISEFGLVIPHGGGREHRHGRMIPQHDRDPERNVIAFGRHDLSAHIVAGHRKKGDQIGTVNLDPVDADILFFKILGLVRVAADDIGLPDIKTAVIFVDPVQRQDVIEIDVLLDPVLMNGRFPGRKAPKIGLGRAPAPHDIEKQLANGGALGMA